MNRIRTSAEPPGEIEPGTIWPVPDEYKGVEARPGGGGGGIIPWGLAAILVWILAGLLLFARPPA